MIIYTVNTYVHIYNYIDVLKNKNLLNTSNIDELAIGTYMWIIPIKYIIKSMNKQLRRWLFDYFILFISLFNYFPV
jgi:hypothetical protein